MIWDFIYLCTSTIVVPLHNMSNTIINLPNSLIKNNFDKNRKIINFIILLYTKITKLYSYIKQIQIFKWITEFLSFSLKRNNVYINISNKHNLKSIHSPKNCGSNWNEVVLFQKQIQRLSIEEPIYILSCYFNSTCNNWWLLETLANSNEMDNQHPSL